ncbi:hypothetical protein BGZ94_009023 [Podila epigama]|nr:hypothetical protein BGZ94_009023 [Podila epigama]
MDDMEIVRSYTVSGSDPQQAQTQAQAQAQAESEAARVLAQTQVQTQAHEQQQEQVQEQKDLSQNPLNDIQVYPGAQQYSLQPPYQDHHFDSEKIDNDSAQLASFANHRSYTVPLPNHDAVTQCSYPEIEYDAQNQHLVQNYHTRYEVQHHHAHHNHELHGNGDGTSSSCSSCRQLSKMGRIRRRIGHAIESRAAHMSILLLTLCDIILVMLQIGASLLHLDETKEEVWYIELFSHLSLAIVSLFMVEILLKLFAFGPRYFWRGTPHWVLHLVDAVIIFTSFMLEIFLHGAEQELSSLIIIFRLWRVVKLTGTVAVEVSTHGQGQVMLLESRIRELEQELHEAKNRCEQLENFNRRVNMERNQ